MLICHTLLTVLFAHIIASEAKWVVEDFLGHLTYHELALFSVHQNSTYCSELFQLTVLLGTIWDISSHMG